MHHLGPYSPVHRHEHGADRVIGGTVLAHQYNDDETYELTLQDKKHIVQLVLSLSDRGFMVKKCKCQEAAFDGPAYGDILRSCHSTASNGRRTLKEMLKVKFPKVEMLATAVMHK